MSNSRTTDIDTDTDDMSTDNTGTANTEETTSTMTTTSTETTITTPPAAARRAAGGGGLGGGRCAGRGHLCRGLHSSSSLYVGSVESLLLFPDSLRVLPALWPALKKYEDDIASDKDARQRLASYRSAVGERESDLVTFSEWSREPAGRIHVAAPCIANIARVLRPHFAPSLDGYVFLDADYKGAHVQIAGVRTGEAMLLHTPGGDLYIHLVREVLPEHAHDEAMLGAARAQIKRVPLAFLNGGDNTTVAHMLIPLVGEDRAGAVARDLYDWWWRSLPRLSAFRAHAQEVWATALERAKATEAHGMSGTFTRTLTGRIVQIPIRLHRRQGWNENGWKSLLSSAWSSVEAEALDRVLERLQDLLGPYGGALVCPMYDGLLATVPREHAWAAGEELRRLMEYGAKLAAITGARAVVKVQDRWGVTVPGGLIGG